MGALCSLSIVGEIHILTCLPLRMDSAMFNLLNFWFMLFSQCLFKIQIYENPSVTSYISCDALCLYQLLWREILFGIFITSLSLIITLTMCYGVYPCSHLERHICHEIWDLLCSAYAHS